MKVKFMPFSNIVFLIGFYPKTYLTNNHAKMNEIEKRLVGKSPVHVELGRTSHVNLLSCFRSLIAFVAAMTPRSKRIQVIIPM